MVAELPADFAGPAIVGVLAGVLVVDAVEPATPGATGILVVLSALVVLAGYWPCRGVVTLRLALRGGDRREWVRPPCHTAVAADVIAAKG